MGYRHTHPLGRAPFARQAAALFGARYRQDQAGARDPYAGLGRAIARLPARNRCWLSPIAAPRIASALGTAIIPSGHRRPDLPAARVWESNAVCSMIEQMI